MSEDDTPSAARSFIALAALAAVLLSSIVRARIHVELAYRSIEPVRWFVGGFIGDVAVIAAAVTPALWVSSFKRLRLAGAIGFGAFVIIFLFANLALSEAVTVLGGPLRPEDFRGALAMSTLLRSVATRRGAVAVLVVIGAALAIPLLVTVLVPRPFAKFKATHAAAVAVAALMAMPFFESAHRIQSGRNCVWAFVRLARQERQSVVSGQSEVTYPGIDESGIRELTALPPNDYISNSYPMAHFESRAISRPTTHPNIVIIAMESMRAEEMGCYGADPPGLTPNIDALAREGVRVDPAYSNGTYTASAEISLLYGLPPLPTEVLLSSRPDVALTGLPEILRASGWKDFFWIHDGDSNFYRRDLFYKRRGIIMIDGREFPQSAPSTNWGFSDRTLARVAVDVFDHARPPFGAFVLTVTNHHAYQLPADSSGQFITPEIKRAREAEVRPRILPMLQTIHYTDEAIGDFFRLARKRPWFANTIFVLTGDHGLALPPLGRPIDSAPALNEILHRVPLIFYSPLLRGGYTLAGPASHVDVMPTLLGLAGVALPRSGIGVDLFAPDEVQRRSVVLWTPHSRTVVVRTARRLYLATYPSDELMVRGEPNELLVDPIHDAGGTHDLAAEEPETVHRCRRIARVYVALYPWLVVNGHSGVPPDVLSGRTKVQPPVLAQNPDRATLAN